MLSPDGKCKTFDSSANGYVRSEGCGVVIIKRLSQALKDKDNIRAVIAGTAVNHSGKSNGLTAPNGLAQQDVMKSALKMSGLSPNDISFLEAHGTGTPLGDPIEMQAIMEVFGKNRQEGFPLIVGSVKTNIGHSEIASGIAGKNI
jgi:acyl transferase domain-containing protein